MPAAATISGVRRYRKSVIDNLELLRITSPPLQYIKCIIRLIILQDKRWCIQISCYFILLLTCISKSGLKQRENQCERKNVTSMVTTLLGLDGLWTPGIYTV